MAWKRKKIIHTSYLENLSESVRRVKRKGITHTLFLKSLKICKRSWQINQNKHIWFISLFLFTLLCWQCEGLIIVSWAKILTKTSQHFINYSFFEKISSEISNMYFFKKSLLKHTYKFHSQNLPLVLSLHAVP